MKSNDDHKLASAHSKTLDNRKVSNLIMMFEERSEGLKLLKNLNK